MGLNWAGIGFAVAEFNAHTLLKRAVGRAHSPFRPRYRASCRGGVRDTCRCQMLARTCGGEAEEKLGRKSHSVGHARGSAVPLQVGPLRY